MEATPEYAQVYYNMAQMVRPCLTTLGVGRGDPSPLWQAWTDRVTRDLSALCRRGRARAAFGRNRNNHGVAWTHPNANMNPPPDEDSEEVGLMERASKKKPNRPGRQRRHKNRLREQTRRDTVASDTWVGPDRMPARTLPHTRWLRSPPPWRHSAPNLRRRGRDKKRPAAATVCVDAEEDQPAQWADATPATSSRSSAPPVALEPGAPVGTHEVTPDGNASDNGDTSNMPAQTADFWREHLGISLPLLFL